MPSYPDARLVTGLAVLLALGVLVMASLVARANDPQDLRGRAVLAIAACGGALSVLGFLRAAAIPWYNDSFIYLSLGEHLARGEGYKSTLFLFHDLIQPPFYPMTVAAGVWLTRSPLLAAILVHLLIGALVVLGAARLFRLLWPEDRTGWAFTAALAAVTPVFGLSSNLASDEVYACLALWSFGFGVAAYRSGKPRDWAVAAALAGCSILTRPEGLALTLVILALPLVSAGPVAKRIVRSSVGLAAAVIIVVPYVLFIRAHLGYATLVPKAVYNGPLAELLRDIQWPEDQAKLLSRDMRIGSALMPNHKDFALVEKFVHPETDIRSLFPLHPHGRPALAAVKALAATLKIVVWSGVRRLGLMHPAFAGLAAFALFRAWKERVQETRWPLAALVGLIAVHLLPAMAGDINFENRFLATSTLFCLPLVGRGAALVSGWIAGRAPTGIARFATLAIGAPLILLSASIAGALARETGGDAERVTRTVAAGEQCEKLIPRGSRIMSLNARCAYLVGGDFFATPYVETLAELTSFVEQHGVEYVEMDPPPLKRHPSALLRNMINTAEWPEGWTVLADESRGAPRWILRVAPATAAR